MIRWELSMNKRLLNHMSIIGKKCCILWKKTPIKICKRMHRNRVLELSHGTYLSNENNTYYFFQLSSRQNLDVNINTNYLTRKRKEGAFPIWKYHTYYKVSLSKWHLNSKLKFLFDIPTPIKEWQRRLFNK